VQLARHALRKVGARLQGQVLDWNAPSIEFYKSIGTES